MPLSRPKQSTTFFNWLGGDTLSHWTHPETGRMYGVSGDGKQIRGVCIERLPNNATFYQAETTDTTCALDEGRRLLFEEAGPCITQTQASVWRCLSKTGKQSRLRLLIGWGDRLRLIHADPTDPPGLHPADFCRNLPPRMISGLPIDFDLVEIYAPSNPETWAPMPWFMWWANFEGFAAVMPRRLP